MSWPGRTPRRTLIIADFKRISYKVPFWAYSLLDRSGAVTVTTRRVYIRMSNTLVNSNT